MVRLICKVAWMIHDPNEREIYKPLFAQGSELVYTESDGTIKNIQEFKGLGITVASPEEVGAEKYASIMGNGQGNLSGVKEILVPYVKNGQKVYIQTEGDVIHHVG